MKVWQRVIREKEELNYDGSYKIPGKPDLKKSYIQNCKIQYDRVKIIDSLQQRFGEVVIEPW